MALEQLLKVGDGLYDFTFPIAPGSGNPGFVNTGVIDAKMKVKRLRKTVVKRRIFKKNTVQVTVSYDEVEFRWLPWVSGKINYAQCEGKDVLSGMFTGCWMTLYKEAGTMRVGHVATQKDDGDCKAIWDNHRNSPGVSDVKEFRPDIGLAGTFNLGLVTSTGALYKFQLETDKTITIPNPWDTVEDWMAADKGKVTDRAMASFFATQTDVLAKSVFGGASYRIAKIKGPVSPETFPPTT